VIRKALLSVFALAAAAVVSGAFAVAGASSIDAGNSIAGTWLVTVNGRATLYDLNGNVLQNFPVVASGTRLPVERIPES
jgi:hypothetical protein